MEQFHIVIGECSLCDKGFVGLSFTWTNKRGGLANVQERLDRGLCSLKWREHFPTIVCTHLPFLSLDHKPILIGEQGGTYQFGKEKRKKMMFESLWIGEEGFEDLVRNSWLSNRIEGSVAQFSKALKNCMKEMFGWGLATFKSIPTIIAALKEKINVL